jgi:hypothetical protein
MPASEFESALTERVDYAVFVAYDTWAREVGYNAHNPYDVLARLLNGLPQALSAAVAERGGWTALDPTGGANSAATRHLVSEMAAQVVSARIQSEAAQVPDIGLLTGLIVDAVSGAVTVFLREPGTFELAGVDAPTGISLGERSAPAAVAEAPVVEPESFVATPQPSPDDLGGLPAQNFITATGSSSTRFDAWDSWLSDFNTIFGSSSEFQLIDPNGGVDVYLIRRDTDPAPDLVAENPGGPASGGSGGFPGPSPSGNQVEIAQLVERWERALADATFYRVDRGTVVRLTDAEAESVIDALIARVVEQAIYSMGTPTTTDRPPEPPAIDPVAPDAPVAIVTNQDVFFPV